MLACVIPDFKPATVTAWYDTLIRVNNKQPSWYNPGPNNINEFNHINASKKHGLMALCDGIKNGAFEYEQESAPLPLPMSRTWYDRDGAMVFQEGGMSGFGNCERIELIRE
ncbi:hypothetical protein WICPIJ_001573 [Wickerhamomyces pijperi]|uniref:Uncharacterized protein n=1 Tax=Wickerhamomyces pijperi TaxID=599730 RepID=A0A9P8QBE9_WICPI|nr:hypothetical protein WICPIJ_001573 [Wickerhamomyces pijperi]